MYANFLFQMEKKFFLPLNNKETKYKKNIMSLFMSYNLLETFFFFTEFTQNFIMRNMNRKMLVLNPDYADHVVYNVIIRFLFGLFSPTTTCLIPLKYMVYF